MKILWIASEHKLQGISAWWWHSCGSVHHNTLSTWIALNTLSTCYERHPFPGRKCLVSFAYLDRFGGGEWSERLCLWVLVVSPCLSLSLCRSWSDRSHWCLNISWAVALLSVLKSNIGKRNDDSSLAYEKTKRMWASYLEKSNKRDYTISSWSPMISSHRNCKVQSSRFSNRPHWKEGKSSRKSVISNLC